MRDFNKFEDLEDVREFLFEIYGKSEKWLKAHEGQNDLVEYELIEACNALAFDRLNWSHCNEKENEQRNPKF